MTEPDAPLRLCVLGDLESIHTRRWMQPFVARGHELHAVSYYPPSTSIEGVTVHALDPQRPSRSDEMPSPAAPPRRLTTALPPTALRLINAFRYRRRGLSRVIQEIQPHLLHGHYVVEYGFFAATSGFHPLVVTAWGSDILVAAQTSPLGRLIARYTLRRADLITSNNGFMTRKIVDLGIPAEKIETVVLGTDRFFLEQPEASVNTRDPDPTYPPTVISTRSLDSPLYEIDTILRAMAIVRRRLQTAQLLVAGSGRLQPALHKLAQDLGLAENVRFVGFLDQEALRSALTSAHVYVSVPRSDATSVSTLSAMAVGCFPVVSDLPTQEEWIEDGVNGFHVPAGDVAALARRLGDALENAALRRDAAPRNRRLVEERGLWERYVPQMEALYRRLARRAD
jgi:glycosyltransferase involved in cell wall biosynthesis